MSENIPMAIDGVQVGFSSATPVVLLKEAEGERYLPIWIGAVEATAIVAALEEMVPPRPLTHDLLRMAVESLGAEVHRAVVTEVRDNVFYAELVLLTKGGEIKVSCRPSDAIALAVRTEAPLFAHYEVLDEAGVMIKSVEEPEEQIEEFRRFLEVVSPEDFSSGESPQSPDDPDPSSASPEAGA
jgi:bifunctional DNase/RNase